MPSVVRFIAARVRKRWNLRTRFSKRSVFLRDQGQCQYCAKYLTFGQVHFDHVMPRSRGGLTNWQNYVVCCFSCNQRKKNRTPEEADMPLLYKPVAPKTLPCHPCRAPENIPESWLPYIK